MSKVVQIAASECENNLTVYALSDTGEIFMGYGNSNRQFQWDRLPNLPKYFERSVKAHINTGEYISSQKMFPPGLEEVLSIEPVGEDLRIRFKTNSSSERVFLFLNVDRAFVEDFVNKSIERKLSFSLGCFLTFAWKEEAV